MQWCQSFGIPDICTAQLVTAIIYWADDKQSKARNLDSKYRQMALVGYDT